MKIGSVAKLDKRNMATSKMFDDGGMSANCDDIVIFPIYGQVEAIWKLDSGHVVINRNLLSCKIWKQIWKISNNYQIIALSMDILSLSKNVYFWKKCWHQQS